MPQVILVAASNADAQRHHEVMVRQGVPLARILPFVEAPLADALRTRYDDGVVRVWGTTPGQNNTRYWERMRPGDIALFYQEGELRSSATLTFKVRNAPLATDLWRLDPQKNEPWELMYFLEDHREEAIPYPALWEIARQGPQNALRGLTVLSPERSREVVEAFGLGREDEGQKEEEELIGAVEAVRSYSRGQGFRVTAETRIAIEGYAMRRAEEHFRTRGFEVEDVSRRASYDLRCTRGDQELFVEVKGTQSTGDEILLTPNEVRLAENNRAKMALFIVHSVDVTVSDTGVEASGGEERVLRPWDITTGELRPLGFSYRIP